MEKQYSKRVITNIIHFMAQASAGILPDKEEAHKKLNEIPEEFRKDIIASVLAARTVAELMSSKHSSTLEEVIKTVAEIQQN